MNDNTEFNANEIEGMYLMVLSTLADAYLQKIGAESVEESLAKEGKTYVPGKELYGSQAMALKELLNEEMKIMGLSLPDEVAKHGETFEKTSFSSYENELLKNKVSNLTFFLDVINKRNG